MNEPNLNQIKEAHQRINPYIHRTPVMTSQALNQLCQAELFFKCENLQKVGAFKMRGASNAVFSLTAEEARCGVATHSSGNHAAALALAARYRGIKAYIVMPQSAPQIKKNAVAGYGAEIIFCQPTLQSREETLEKVVEQTGAIIIHPYNDYRIIAGQATAALELIEDTTDLNIIMTPVGGGGLLSGTSLSVSYLAPQAIVIAGEPKGADDAYRSLQAGKILPSVNPKTIADGLLTSLGEKTFPIIQKRVKEIITVSEENIIKAMRYIWERMKIIVEPSSAVPLAAIFEKQDIFQGKRIGIILSGGNVELSNLPW